jgi:Kef-type K+ transport system membrane component KefB
MDILYLILVLLVVTRVFAELAERIRVPAIVGELTAGVVLGLLLANYHDNAPVLWEATRSETFDSLVSLGMFFLMLLAGVRMEPLDFARTSKTAIFVALGGMAVPVGAGLLVGAIVLPESPFKFEQSLFLGVALAITAVPVAVRIFLDVGLLETRVGKTVIAAALWDDLIGLFLLAFLIAAITNGEVAAFSGSEALMLLGKVVLFFALTIPVGLWAFPILGRYIQHLRFPEIDFSMLMIAAFAFAVFAERMDLHFIIGAFLAGMFFHPGNASEEIYDRVEKQISGIARGFLAPIFFVSVGLHLDFSALGSTPGFVVVMILVALFSKFVGAGLPAYWVGLSKPEALMVGIGMSGRGAVELIVAGVALQAGLFLQPSPPPPIVASMYSAVVIMALVTTVLTPLILRRFVDNAKPGQR